MSELPFRDGALLAGLVLVALMLGPRVYGAVRQRRVERMLIVGIGPLVRLVIGEIARRPHRDTPDVHFIVSHSMVTHEPHGIAGTGVGIGTDLCQGRI